MSRKKRVLRRLHLVESDLQKTAKTNSKAMWGIVSKGLIAARDIWQEGLTEKTYLAYGEIYGGLILASQQMAASEEKSIEADTISLCRELLQYLIGQTEKETAIKKDIVFLPYKASMWDSLESVWKAAYADKEHCNAYVMPIPYCDRKPDGSVAEWHCERDLFPKYVPTLDWQKVDLIAWHPDIIFYHYPYDDYNRVTSLDGRYYSRNLRQCADKLVYIPYFVLDEPCTEESVEHFVTTQGVLNADKVIVQSEAMRELYINILMKRTNQPDRAYWEERISGAGSPKIEKVLTSKKEDFEMPEKWKRLIDGKKIILYNTSLTAMLQNSDKVCDKLRYVFDVFRNRDDVVLWWRPHPLMKPTFHAMRPQYEDEYLSLEKQYIEEGWGIYDDTADLHRAICWSDAYYGDMSSVLCLYKNTGKPTVLESLLCKDYYLAPISVIDGANYLCYLDITGNIGKIKRKNGNLKFTSLSHIDGENIIQGYSALCPYAKDQAVLVPYLGTSFWLYDLKNDVCSVASHCASENIVECRFQDGIDCGDFIVFLALNRWKIYLFEKKSKIFIPLEDKCDFESMGNQKDSWKFCGTGIGTHVLIIARYTNKILDIDSITTEMKVSKIGDNSIRFDKVFSNQRFVFFKTFENQMICVEYETGQIKNLQLPQSFTSKGFDWHSFGITEANIYIIAIRSFESASYICLDLETWSFSDERRIPGVEEVHEFQHEDGERFWLGCIGNGQTFLGLFDLRENVCLERYEIKLDDTYREKFIDKVWEKLYSKHETKTTLPEAVVSFDVLSRHIKGKISRVVMKELPGECIYRSLIQEQR